MRKFFSLYLSYFITINLLVKNYYRILIILYMHMYTQMYNIMTKYLIFKQSNDYHLHIHIFDNIIIITYFLISLE
jgi:hypothetical protein